MGDYELEMWEESQRQLEEDMEAQFRANHADELEMMAELDGGPPAPSSRVRQALYPSAATNSASSSSATTSASRKRAAAGADPIDSASVAASNSAAKQPNPWGDSSDEDEDGDMAAGDGSLLRAKRPRRASRPTRAPTPPPQQHQPLDRQPTDKESTPVVASDGSMLFFGMRPESASDLVPNSLTNTGSLLGTSFDTIQHQVRNERIKTAMEENAARKEAMEKLRRDLTSDDADDYLPPIPSTPPRTKLWVNEYEPRRYCDLVSDEEVNRQLLSWLKRWDEIVFHRKSQVPTISVNERIQRKRGLDENGQATFQRRTFGSGIGDEDFKKVVLLCGPPGIGKTTLAHVAARHCGYQPFEINASDDRSADALRTRLRAASEMQDVLSIDGRPNCIILDEIDGSSKAAINVLIQIVQAGEGKNADNADGEKKKKKKKQPPLRRPIICICNDVQAPTLRALRKVAMQVTMAPLDTARLVNRLLDICRSKQIKTDMRSLTSLCDLSSGDIRSCVSTLQFATLKTGQFSAAELRSCSVGKKDQETGIFSVWDKIFRLSRGMQATEHSRNVKRMRQTHQTANERFSASKRSAGGPARGRLEEVLGEVYANGEFEKALDGCFENYLGLIGKGDVDSLAKVADVSDWCHFFDGINDKIMQQRNYGLMKFCALPMAAFHFAFASTKRPALHFPRLGHEARQHATANAATVRALLDEAQPAVRRSLTLDQLVLDVLTPLLDLLTPQLRPVQVALLNAEEKALLTRVVQTMVAYNVNLLQRRNPGSGRYEYQLDPPLEDMMRFGSLQQQLLNHGRKGDFGPGAGSAAGSASGSGSAGAEALVARQVARVKRLAYGTRQLLAQEVVRERLRQHGRGDKVLAPAEQSPKSGAGAAVADPQQPSSSSLTAVSETHAPKAATQTLRLDETERKAFLQARMGLQKSTAKVKDEKVISRDFFGRIIAPTPELASPRAHPSDAAAAAAAAAATASADDDVADGGAALSALVFKFHEGFSNAVRRPARMRDLL